MMIHLLFFFELPEAFEHLGQRRDRRLRAAKLIASFERR